MCHSGPEIACDDWSVFVDCCAHDMWGAGCLMYQAFTTESQWSMCQSLEELQDAQSTWVGSHPLHCRLCNVICTVVCVCSLIACVFGSRCYAQLLSMLENVTSLDGASLT